MTVSAQTGRPDFFAAHTVTELEGWADYELEMQGRLTHPMVYDAASDRYVPIGWDDALALVARHLNALPDPNAAEFYTSGRTSNEAAFPENPRSLRRATTVEVKAVFSRRRSGSVIAPSMRSCRSLCAAESTASCP